MKPPSDNHDLIRWLDGEMNEVERALFEGLLAQDPALNKEAMEMKALSDGIRSHLPKEMEVPYADFFNSQIQVRIAQIDAESAGQKSPLSVGAVLQWFRRPWFAVAGAAAMGVASFMTLAPASADHNSRILSSYTPNAHVQARTFHDDAAQATVLMLDGLDEVPADRKVSGLNVHRSETDPEIAATSLYDAAGVRLLTVSRDAAGNPLFWRNSPRG